MNIEEYISSGIVEAYVLGVATDEEVREIEQLMTQHPELVAAIREQEDVLINYARENAVMPPTQLKQTIWQALSGDTMDEAEPTITSTPKINITPNAPAKTGWNKYALAASLALLIASAAANVWQMGENNKMKNDVAVLAANQKVLTKEKDNAQAAAQKANNAIEVLSLPKLLKINLAGVGTHTAETAMLYWDGASGDVYVDLDKMPEAPAGKQYQLWAIVDGKPVDAGMYEANNHLTLHKMKNIPKAEMFAITIENSGGSPSPTMEQMVVAGKTS